MQTSPVDHVVRPRRHRGQVVLAAVAMVTALLGASAVVLLAYSFGRAQAGADKDSLSVDSLTVFDPDPTLPATQVSTATVINQGTTDIQIDHISFALTLPDGGDGPDGGGGLAAADPSSGSSSSSAAASSSGAPPPTIPLEVFPGENCTGATVPPNGYCAVSVRYTNPGQQFSGTLDVTAHDGSVAHGDTGTRSESHLDSILADPYVVDFGSRPVGTTSPAHTVTIGAAPSAVHYQVVGVSVVDTVPTPGAKADYRITTDGCTGVDLGPPLSSDGDVRLAVLPFPLPSCVVTVTDTPGAAGDRPAFLSVAYCGDNTGGGLGFASDVQPHDTPGTPAPTSTEPPLDNNVFCPTGNHVPAFHQLVKLTGAGQSASTTNPPPTTTTTAPPTTTTTAPVTTTVPTTPPTFTPKVTAVPPLAPAGRTTAISGTGWPPNTKVTYALVPPNTDPTLDLSTVPGFATATTAANGAFANKIIVIMPHTPAGQYEILATALFGRTPVSASVGFLVAPGSQQPPKFVGRH